MLDHRQLERIQSVHRGFLYQHLYAAGCLLKAGGSGTKVVRVENDEDIEVVGLAGCQYVQVKTRSESPQLLVRARAAIEGLRGAAEMVTAQMSLAKGLEFRAVVVMACDEGVLPLDERVADAADEAELDDIYETERRLLYVACTRACEHLLLTGVTPASEYLADLQAKAG